jgi:ferredoxin
MARRDLRHPAGIDGPWFVDDRCIDCDAARQVAPGLIARNPGDGVSVFTRQPQTDDEVTMAWRAVLACPTRSVGHETIRQPPPDRSPASPARACASTGSSAVTGGAMTHLPSSSTTTSTTSSPGCPRNAEAVHEPIGRTEAGEPVRGHRSP